MALVTCKTTSFSLDDIGHSRKNSRFISPRVRDDDIVLSAPCRRLDTQMIRMNVIWSGANCDAQRREWPSKHSCITPHCESTPSRSRIWSNSTECMSFCRAGQTCQCTTSQRASRTCSLISAGQLCRRSRMSINNSIITARVKKTHIIFCARIGS